MTLYRRYCGGAHLAEVVARRARRARRGGSILGGGFWDTWCGGRVKVLVRAADHWRTLTCRITQSPPDEPLPGDY